MGALQNKTLRFLSLGLAILTGGIFLPSKAQAAPSISSVQPSSLQKINFPFAASSTDGGKPFMEIAPSIIPGGWRGYITSSYETYNCVAPWALTDTTKSGSATCTQVLAPTVDDSRNPYTFGPAQVNGVNDWRRNYYGIFNAFVTTGQTGTQSILSIVHGENKGEYPYAGKNTSTFFPNTIAPNMKNTVGDTSKGCFEANGCYFAFVGATWIPYTQQYNWGQYAFWDMGPVVWPSAGYVSADGLTKISNGPRHPQAIIYNNYIYVFYTDHLYMTDKDNNKALDVGDRRSGVKLIRAPLPLANPTTFKAYYNGSFSEAALPSGFDKGNLKSFISKQGPRATPVFTTLNNRGSSETISFSVAKVRGKTLFVGVEQYIDYGSEATAVCGGKIRMALRVSSDLINWSKRTNITSCPADNNSFKAWYPKFMDSSGWSNTEIDLNNFYILGTANDERTSAGLALYGMAMNISVKE